MFGWLCWYVVLVFQFHNGDKHGQGQFKHYCYPPLIKRHDTAPYGARMAWVAGCDDKESERWGWGTLRITKTQLLGNAYF